MASPTRAQYRLEVRRLLHDANGKFYSDTDLNDYINDGRRRTCSDTGCLRRLVTAYLSRGLEQYPIGGVTGGLVTAPGGGYTTITITVNGDGSGATAVGTLSPIGTSSAGGSVVQLFYVPGSGYSTAPAISFSGGGGSGAAAIAHFKLTVANALAAGTGYQVGDILTLTGGTSITPAKVMVTVLNPGGAIAFMQIMTAGEYTVLPPNLPIPLSGGSGTGATASVQWGIIPILTAPGSGYATPPTVTVAGGLGATIVAALGSTSGAGGQLTAITVTNPGTGYTQATFAISGDGYGAAATAGVIPSTSLDIMNITPLWGNLAPPLNYQPWTEFNARMRVLRSNLQRPCVWSRYGTSGGTAFVQPIPDQTYPAEFDTAILPDDLTDDTTPDTIAFPYTSPPAYYAAWKAKLNQQQFNEAQSFLNDYRRKVLEAQASVQMRRIPNPYGGYSGG